ncbi:outer membrane family protein, partial [Helicobacter pylori]
WEVYYQPYKTETQRLRFWWWSSFGRGLAFNSWIYEFFATVPYLKKGGNPSNSNDFINYGWHGITATYSYKGLDAQF